MPLPHFTAKSTNKLNQYHSSKLSRWGDREQRHSGPSWSFWKQHGYCSSWLRGQNAARLNGMTQRGVGGVLTTAHSGTEGCGRQVAIFEHIFLGGRIGKHNTRNWECRIGLLYLANRCSLRELSVAVGIETGHFAGQCGALNRYAFSGPRRVWTMRSRSYCVM